MTPDEAAAVRRRLRRRIGRVLRSGAALARRAVGLTLEGTRLVARDARESWRGRRGARLGALDRLNRVPLPSLYALHPEARQHMRREIGLRSIPLDEIAGTAVAGPAQRGSDFTPMPAFRGQNWEGRWQRIDRAVKELAILPPIDVLRFGDRYWVEDGHNRVAAALRNGQVEIDAAVTELRPPSATSPVATRTDLAPMLEAGRELRAAGEGRFSVQAASLLASSADESDDGHGHAHDDGHDHDEDAGDASTALAEESRRRRVRRIRHRRSAGGGAADAPSDPPEAATSPTDAAGGLPAGTAGPTDGAAAPAGRADRAPDRPAITDRETGTPGTPPVRS